LKNVWKKIQMNRSCIHLYSPVWPQAENGKVGKDKESMTEKRNQRELLWFQTGGALNFITAVPHCGDLSGNG
jgi:hypothetical protein